MQSNFSELHQNQTIDLNPAASYSGQGSGKVSSMNSIDGNKSGKLLTLDEPVFVTIKRDLMNVFNKMKNVFTTSQTGSHLDSLRNNWDLWGPLIISLAIASTVTIGSHTDTEELFTNIFLALWIGPFVISINCQLLGANIMIIQLVSLIIYCSAPIMIYSIICFVLRIFVKLFIVDLVLAVVAVFLTIRGTKGYFTSLVDQDKKRLMLYPVLLFYIFLATYIAMA